MSYLKLKSKADNLSQLSQKVTKAILLPQIVINYQQWISSFDLKSTLEEREWNTIKLIIRSSAKKEDNLGNSLAGRYLSLANKVGIFEVKDAISQVFSSYKDKSENNQVFIQPMISNPKIQGVAFSKEPSHNNQYFVINYTSSNETTDQITNGSCIDDDVMYVARYLEKHPTYWVQKVIELITELESIYQNTNLDIEFILTQQNELILLQVRELYILTKKTSKFNQKKILEQLKKHYVNHKEQSPVYGLMPDWNPAEILGIRPNTLALSLYKELITNEVWANSRKKYGYKYISETPLLIDFHGMPYIDVKSSFSSLIPDNVTKKLSGKLINYYLEKLKSQPHLHDKIESEIVFSSDCFTIKNKVNKLQKHGFTKDECQQLIVSLKHLTNKIIQPKTGHAQLDLESLSSLVHNHQLIMDSDDSFQNKIIKIISLCKKKGTLPFAGLARTAFIAKQYLNSLEEIGLFSQDNTETFNQSISTTVQQLISKFNKSDKKTFLTKFGHLRPDSYNLLSPRYDDLKSDYFDWASQIKEEEIKAFTLSSKQKNEMDKLLVQHSIPYQANDFIDFLRSAICNREHAKFLFSLLLSDILKLSESFAKQIKINKENIVYLTIRQITSLTDKSLSEGLIKNSKQEELIRNSLILPSLITNESNFDHFKNIKTQANFITLNSTTAKPLNLNKSSTIFKGAMVLIKHADPGYDWIFTHEISGLITMFGGCNSHMAIRSAELNLPAAIGVGETAFNHYLKAKLIYLDCSKKWIKILK